MTDRPLASGTVFTLTPLFVGSTALLVAHPPPSLSIQFYGTAGKVFPPTVVDQPAVPASPTTGQLWPRAT